jgi:omega-6 fatty acid desaturase (delta-12 desaturase)
VTCSAVTAAPAVAAPADAGRLSAEGRAALAEQLGYRTIGADLPEDVTLTQIISSLPKEVGPVIIPPPHLRINAS